MASWDSNKVKAQLRYTAQRLGQVQDKLESQGQITRADIATLLYQGNVPLARAKAQKLASQDIYEDLLQTLEMLVGVILEHIGELEKSEAPSPMVVEAASSIIFAAPQVDSRDLFVTRDMLCARLGPDFARSAAGNADGYVSPRIVRALSAGPLSASKMDQFLFTIAKAHNVKWFPELQPHERVNAISEMLDPASIPEIDIKRLRELCAHGLPEYPPWLRPRVWRLLLGTLPAQKASWKEEASKQRENYYDLVRRLLEPFSSLPTPETPLGPLDTTLNDASKELSRVPPGLFSKLQEEPEGSKLCPLDDSADEEIKITCAGALDARLRMIRESEQQDTNPQSSGTETPEIRLEGTPEIRLEISEEQSAEEDGKLDALQIDADLAQPSTPLTPEISLSVPGSPTSTHSGATTTLLPSRTYTASGAHQNHASALLRLLYIHSTLNPANRAPQIASLLVPVYAALVEEVEPEDLAHLEADAFWLFETIVGEFSELEEVEGGNVWMQKLGERLSWADADLAEILQAKGLDPSLPHYSYRWITTLLTHTLPLPAVLTVWDALFSRPGRERDSNPKLEYLVDVCTSMLLSLRGTLYRLGKPQGKGLYFWSDADIATLELGERELEDAFAAGMTMLQNYPLQDVGGVGNILQLAFDLNTRRQATIVAPTPAGSLGARLRNTMWRGWTPQATTITETQEDGGDERETENDESNSDEDDQPLQRQVQQKRRPPPLNSIPTKNTLSSRLAQTVWKGITNQSAMEAPLTPQTPAFSPNPSETTFSPPAVPPKDELPTAANGVSRGSMIWGYAEKFRDSDTAATLAKVSTNWRVKAMDAWSKRSSVAPPSPSPSTPVSSRLSPGWVPKHGGAGSASVDVPSNRELVEEPKRNSLPEFKQSPEVYSPPARPAFFAPVRDSWMPESRKDQVASPTGSDHSAYSARSEGPGSAKRRPDSLSATSLPDRERTPSPISAGSVRSGAPRPLLLNSTGSLFTHNRQPTLPVNTADKQFAESVRAKRPPASHRDSQSSISSMSPSDRGTFRSPRDSLAAESRVVPLNRKTPSPMARARRQESTSSSVTSEIPPLPQIFPRQRFPMEESSSRRSSGEQPSRESIVESVPRQAQRKDYVSSQPPDTPEYSNGSNEDVHVADGESQRGSVVLSEFGEFNPSTLPSSEKPVTKYQRRANTSLARLQIDESSDSSAAITRAPTRSARVLRSKRYPPRLTGASGGGSKGSISAIERSTTLAAPEWAEEGEATTPRAATFGNGASAPSSPRRRKVSTEGKEGRRKVSVEGKQPKHKRESAAVDGDDEGYDELLSAYESEDSLVR